MGLLEDLTTATPSVGGKQCAVQKLVEEHEDGDDLFEIITHGDVTAPQVSRVLERHGFEVSAKIINNHRNGGCACDRRMPERYE